MRFNSSAWSLRWPAPRQPAPSPIRKVCDTRAARLGEGTRIYAIGDIHGMKPLVISLLNVICEDAAAAVPEPRMTMIVLCGNYIDRGPDSAGVLSILSALSLSGIQVIALRGNHEDMLQRFMEQPERFGPRWMAAGGGQTLHSYGVLIPSGTPESYRQARAALGRCMPVSHISFLSELRSSFSAGDYFFCHAGARPGVPLSKQEEKDLIWMDGSFTQADHGFEKVVVHGHHPAAEPLIGKYRIGIDTGAFATGRLTAAVLDSTGCRFLHADAR